MGLQKSLYFKGCSKESWTLPNKGDSASLREGRRCGSIVNFFSILNIMNVKMGKALAKFVPAAAVKRIERVLFIGTRHKELLGCNLYFL